MPIHIMEEGGLLEHWALVEIRYGEATIRYVDFVRDAGRTREVLELN